MSLQNLYPKSVEILRHVLGAENYKNIEKYLHAYDGSARSVKPVAKYITIYWVGRAADRIILRTEGEDDIILSEVCDVGVPTIPFRKLKAVCLRRFMQFARIQWEMYSNTIKKNAGYDNDYDFLTSCAIAVGIAGAKKGVLHGRCMMCPVDVLMGATSAKTSYTLVGRFVGDAAYALTPNIERRTGSSVGEITNTTIMITESATEEERRTGGLFSETNTEPRTLFVGKIVLFMVSPPELLHVLWLLARDTRVGAEVSIKGTLEMYPVAMIGDLFEVGTAYKAAERAHGIKKLEDARKEIVEYLKNVRFSTATDVIEFTSDISGRLQGVNILDEEVVVELWKNARNYVKGVEEYIRAK